MSTNKLSTNRVIPKYDINKPSVMNINDIYKILPHRYPFALVDKVLHIDNNRIVALKNVTINEPFFRGHFPQNPVMPGVLQIEALAQTGGILMTQNVDDPDKYWAYFLTIENCKFRKIVIPGDTLIMECELEGPLRRNIVKLNGKAYVGNKLVCESKVTAIIVEKDNVK